MSGRDTGMAIGRVLGFVVPPPGWSPPDATIFGSCIEPDVIGGVPVAAEVPDVG